MFNKIKVSHQKGFTLLEILLVIALIAILAGFVITALNPAKRLATARDVQRKSDIETIQKATYQYLIDKNHYPPSLTGISTPTTICDSGANTSPTCSEGTVNLSALVPDYISAVPKEPSATTGAGYQIAMSNNSVYVQAPDTELGYTNQPGYTTTTPVVAFIGPVPSGYSVPTVGSGGGGSESGGSTNYALQFNGSTNYVSVPYSSALYPSNFTIEAWIYPTSMADYKFIINTRNATSGSQGFHVVRWADGTIWFYADGIGGWYQGSIVVPDGSWSHIAVTYDGSTLKTWINGVQDISTNVSGSITDVGNPLYIGTELSLTHNFEGSIDEVRISDTARYTSDFSADFAAHRSNYLNLTNDSHTVALWDFNQGPDGTTLTDPKGNNGTLENSPTWVTPGVE